MPKTENGPRRFVNTAIEGQPAVMLNQLLREGWVKDVPQALVEGIRLLHQEMLNHKLKIQREEGGVEVTA